MNKLEQMKLFALKAEELKLEGERCESERKKLLEEVLVFIEKGEMPNNEIVVDDGKDKLLHALKVDTTRIQYDYEAMKAKLNKQLLSAISNKVVIADTQLLKEIVGGDKELWAKIKTALTLETSLNEAKLDAAYNLGKVTAEELSGCYTIKTNSYIKLTRKERPKLGK